MTKHLVFLFCCVLVIVPWVFGLSYRNSIITTTETYGRDIVIYPGTPYDYATSDNTTFGFRGINFGSVSTDFVATDIDFNRKHQYLFDRQRAHLYRLDNFTWENFFQPDVIGVHAIHKGVSSSVLTRVAVDWVSGNVYWTDPVFSWIGLQYGNRNDGFKIMLHEDMVIPSAIAVDPKNRYLFWSDLDTSAVRIERCSLSGTNRVAIITTGLVDPNSISVDYTTGQIVWVDRSRDTVEIADNDGTNRRTIRRMSHTTFFDVAVFRDYVMVTDYNSGDLRIFNKQTGSMKPSGMADGSHITVKMYSSDTQDLNIANYCTNTTCDHICVNDDGGHTCLCHEGFVLNQDGTTCSEASGVFHRAFIQSNRTHICMMDIRRLSGQHVDVLQCVVSDGTDIAHFDIDMAAREIMIADGCTIYTTNIDNTIRKETFMAMQPCVPITGLALDWRDRNIYWSDANGIHVTTQTKDSFTLIGEDVANPRQLIIVPFKNVMVWVSGTNGAHKIEKADLDGSNRKTIVTSGSPSGPISLTIDRNTNELYFIDQGVLHRCTLDGTDLVSVEGGLAEYHGLLVYKNYLVIAHRGFPFDELTTLELVLGNEIGTQNDIVENQNGMKVMDDLLQPEIQGSCDNLNGGCEQICLPIGRNRLCKCAFGFQLDADKTSCSSEPLADNFLIVTDWTHDKMYMVSMVTNDVRAVDTPTFGSPIAVLYDNATNTVTWSTNQFLHRTHISGTNDIIVRNTEGIGYWFDRLAIDHTSGFMYFTAVSPSAVGKVGVIKPNGDYKFLISDGVQPRAIVLDPEDGLMFWSDHASDPPFVKKANMDGTQIEIIKQTDLQWPNGLGIDTRENKLYIADGYTDIIYKCTYTGSCTTYYEDTGAHLMDLKLVGDYLYYTAWNRLYITKLHKDHITDKGMLARNAELGRLDSITYYMSTFIEPVSSSCSANNGLGPCSTFCLPRPTGYTCACEEGINLRSDGKTCENIQTTTKSISATTTTPKPTITAKPTTTLKPTTRPVTHPPSSPTTHRSPTTQPATSPLTASTSVKPTADERSDDDDDDDKSSVPLPIIGGAVGGVVVLIVAIVIIYFVMCKRNNRTKAPPRSGFEPPMDIATVYSHRQHEHNVHYTRQCNEEEGRRDTTYDVLIQFDDKDDTENKGSSETNPHAQNDYVKMQHPPSGTYETLGWALPTAPAPPVQADAAPPVQADAERDSDYLQPINAFTTISGQDLVNPLYQVD